MVATPVPAGPARLALAMKGYGLSDVEAYTDTLLCTQCFTLPQGAIAVPSRLYLPDCTHWTHRNQTQL